jgi:transposase
LKLAQLVADRPDRRLPVVAVPSDEEMARRKLVSSYRREQENRRRGINRLHGLFVSGGITTVRKQNVACRESRKAVVSRLAGQEWEEADHLMACLELYEQRIAVLEGQMGERMAGDERAARLQSVPGVGPKIAFAFSAYVNEERFENGGPVSNFLGLVPRVYQSGRLVRYGRITKRGNGYLRVLLVQGAWAVTWSKRGGALKERYEYMTREQGLGKKKAIVAVARRLGVLLYTLLKKGTAYEESHLGGAARKPGPEELARIASSA